MASNQILKPGNTALITGAASGIGFAVAKRCHSHGMKLALVDINADDLIKAKDFFGDEIEAHIYPADVSKIEQWKELKSKVDSNFDRIDILMLNAGVASKSTWEDINYFHKIIDTNFFGVINGISTFLPQIRSQTTPSSIIITGSKQGITNPPGNPAYNASKAAIKSVAEQLSYDLRSTPTSVHLLVPGWTHTGLTGAKDKKEKPGGAWSPERVAEFLEEKMEQNVFYVLCPDNDVSVEKNRKRMLWSVGDMVHERPPLSRWREEWKNDAEEWMAKQKI